jgi:transporter family-2 protein
MADLTGRQMKATTPSSYLKRLPRNKPGARIMSSHVIYALLMLAAGIGVPILAAMNARLGTALASPQIAVLILILVAGVMMALVTLLTGLPKTLKADVPFYVYGAGLLFLFYILSITWIAPKFGIGNAIFFALLGQLVSAAVIDHLGLFGAAKTSIDATRLLGLFVMAAGLFLSVKR